MIASIRKCEKAPPSPLSLSTPVPTHVTGESTSVHTLLSLSLFVLTLLSLTLLSIHGCCLLLCYPLAPVCQVKLLEARTAAAAIVRRKAADRRSGSSCTTAAVAAAADATDQTHARHEGCDLNSLPTAGYFVFMMRNSQVSLQCLGSCTSVGCADAGLTLILHCAHTILLPFDIALTACAHTLPLPCDIVLALC